MKQVVQNYRTGDLWLEEVPVPLCRRGGVLVRNEFSVVSSGTERMKVNQARMSLVEKAKARPDKVKQVLQSVSQFGLVETYKKVDERLNALSPLGYSSAGIVTEVGEGIDHLSLGDRVACAGEGIACHAEFVSVPRNLCAKVPDGVSSEDAAFATIGAIAINGVRQAQVALGDTVLVIGLGLVGLLGVQLLRAAGCKVIGVDIDPCKLNLAKECGAETAMLTNDEALPSSINQFTDGRGVDAVYIAASTSTSEPMDLAGEMARDRGRVVVVGMVPVHADWQVYYAKELSIVLARSYGPGRYDANYESKGIDYPVGYVPWTQRRNLEEFLRQIQIGSVRPTSLAPAIFDHGEAPAAYKELHAEPGKHAVGILFRYQQGEIEAGPVSVKKHAGTALGGAVRIGMIGAGNFATGTLIPAIKAAQDAQPVGICSAGGLSAKNAANRHGFSYACSDAKEIIEDPEIDAVIIATRHDTHAKFSLDSLNAGKHVFVEKPLALSEDDLHELRETQRRTGKTLMPGYNRRFSVLSEKTRAFFSDDSGPVEIVCRVNAGPIALDSWYQDAEEGGWRIVSEGCHFVDLISYLSDGIPTSVSALMVGGGVKGRQNDNCIVTLEMDNGSIGTLIYVSNGDPKFSKERIEVFGHERVAVIDNWRSATLMHKGRSRKVRPRKSGKGHKPEMQAFVDSVRNGTAPPIDHHSVFLTSLATFKIQAALLDGERKRLNG